MFSVRRILKRPNRAQVKARKRERPKAFLKGTVEANALLWEVLEENLEVFRLLSRY